MSIQFILPQCTEIYADSVRTQRCSTWPHPTNQAIAKLGIVPGAQ